MTHTTVNTEEESAGSLTRVVHTIDITGLDTAGTEQYDADAEVGISGQTRYGVSVRGMADDAYRVVYDNVADELSVTNAADNTDPTGGTAVGEVVLEVIGT